jgi:DNA primase
MSDNRYQLFDDVLKQVDIVEIASHYIKLQKKGRNYVALCPFHDDKHLGNFYVNQEKQIFKCFACGKSGNAISFVQDIENCSYLRALKKVCDIAGIHDERIDMTLKVTPISKEIQDIYSCLSDIDNFYSSSLFQSEGGGEALKYLHARGLSEDMIRRFHIGYSQENGENIIKFLIDKGYSLKTIDATGIARLDDDPMRDVSAGRITFAISDAENRVIGFSARIFGNLKSDSKYVNTRETKLFVKSKVIYNYANALKEAKRVGYVYLLEGFMDVIACDRVGIKSAICLMGTALTKEHIQLLRYLNVEVRLCLDLDDPGQSNMLKITSLFDEAKLPYVLVDNSQKVDGKDTDEILKNSGDDALRDFLARTVSPLEWILNYFTVKSDLTSIKGRREFVARLVPYLAKVEDSLEYKEYLRIASERSGFLKDDIDSLVDKERAKFAKSKPTSSYLFNPNYKFDVISPLQRKERQLIFYILKNKVALEEFIALKGHFLNSDYNKIYSIVTCYLDDLGKDRSYDLASLVNYIEVDERLSKIEGKKELIDEMDDLYNNEKYVYADYSKDAFDDILLNHAKEATKENLRAEYSNAKSDKDKLEALKKEAIEKSRMLCEEGDDGK